MIWRKINRGVINLALKEFNKIAVIGLGNIAQRHRTNLKILFPETKIISLSSREIVPNEPVQGADHIAKDLNELINLEIDFAIVASPATLHEYFSMRLIESKIPVLIEKPISANYQDAEIIANNSSKFKTPAAVAYNLRYLPSTEIIKKYLDNEFLGGYFL